MKKQLFALIVISSFLGACATSEKDPLQGYRGLSADQIFTRGEAELSHANYSDAAKSFEALDVIYPFGQYNRQANFDIIYAYYMDSDTLSAVSSADHFIQLYPRDPNIDYAYYMRGIANYNQYRSIITRFIYLDPAQRDLTPVKQAYKDFYTVVTLFPGSVYAADARQRMVYLRDILATHELEVSQFYFERRAYVAAVNRATVVVENYSQSPAVVDALAMLVRANRMLHLDKPANDALRVLQANYPNAAVLVPLEK